MSFQVDFLDQNTSDQITADFWIEDGTWVKFKSEVTVDGPIDDASYTVVSYPATRIKAIRREP